MKPVDLRDATWRDVQTHITEDMVKVHLAYQAHGPGTTREVAQKSGISVFTLRPRTTDLFKLGLVVLVANEGTNGVYAYRTRKDAEISRAWQTRADFRARVSRSENSGHAPGDQQDETGQRTVERVGFVTVDQAVQSLPPAEQAALGARLLSRYGHLLKKRNASTTDNLELSLA